VHDRFVGEIKCDRKSTQKQGAKARHGLLKRKKERECVIAIRRIRSSTSQLWNVSKDALSQPKHHLLQLKLSRDHKRQPSPRVCAALEEKDIVSLDYPHGPCAFARATVLPKCCVCRYTPTDGRSLLSHATSAEAPSSSTLSRIAILD
jgi:hypothetical protein